MFKTLAGGGQTIAHGVRMLRQVVKIAILVALGVALAYVRLELVLNFLDRIRF